MNFELDKIYHGFKLIEENHVKEINSTARVFLHEKSGAKLLNLQNDDDNKVFAIGFRTPPSDSTGVPHILEHSVLCGSRKFPIKDPFVELAKGSLNTFLNAMTYSDKTLYPVASKNEKDFFNLMDVYLDAALHPNIYKYPEILMQEGWHYELDNKDDEITYKGVVYNEMKGAFSSPDDMLYRKIQESLFPNTTYGVESGGDPAEIPNLTYEQFTNFHKRFYHPSNSYIYLYGDGDLDKQLKFINEEYLQEFDKIDIDSHIDVEKPFNQIKEVTAEYPVSPNDNGKDKTYFGLSFVVGECTDPELCLAFEILEYLLLETPAAPLKKALIESALGKDVYGFYDNSILQPVFSIILKNSNEDKKESFKKLVFDTLRDLVKNGIDKKLVEACINIKEFRLREGDTRTYPKGLLYYTKALDSWLHDKNPLAHLEYEKTLEKVKSALETDYFEKLIEKYLINTKHSSLLVLKPRPGMAEEKAEAVRKKLNDYKKSLSNEEIDKLVKDTQALKERQVSGEKPEDLEKIPLLSLADIDPKAEELTLEEREICGNKMIFCDMFTNKIVYLRFIFDTRTVEEELIPYVGFLSAVLGKIGTENYSYMDLANEVNIYTGGIGYSTNTYILNNTEGEYVPKFLVQSKALVDKFSKLTELLEEIILRTKFDDKKRLKEIIQELKSRLEMAIFDAGHIVAAHRLFSYFSPIGQYEEAIAGLNFYKFIEDLDKNFDLKYDEIISNLQKISKKIFNKNNLIISAALEDADYNVIEKNICPLVSKFASEKTEFKEYKFDVKAYNEGLMTQSDVQYVAKGCNYKKLGYEYKGSLLVLKTIASLDYLWNNVRVLGGAYGAFASFGRSGNMFLGSYRDPNLKETLNIYDNLENYLRNFEADNREMTKYIIGTISNLDTPLTPPMKADKAVAYYLSNITKEDVQKERDEVLGASQDDIRSFADMIGDAMKENYLCVLGNEAKIRANKEVFYNLVEVFN